MKNHGNGCVSEEKENGTKKKNKKRKGNENKKGKEVLLLFQFCCQQRRNSRSIQSKKEQMNNIFLNLTNHPSKGWSQKQLDEAKEWGQCDIVDVAFPNVNPEASSQQIRLEAEALANKIKKEHRDKDTIYVHVQGESTFSFALVTILMQQKNIVCLASTTARIVEEKEGKKIVTFNFVRFREYPSFY